MKYLLLSSVFILSMARTVSGFVNNGVIQVPPMDPALIQIDDPIFVNNALFSVDLTSENLFISEESLFETSDTLNYTNNGKMIGVPGFDFETFPASFGQVHPANSFVNKANGQGGGSIFCTNIYGGLDPFVLGLDIGVVGLATFRVHADNIEDSGLISLDESGLIDLVGKNVDLTHATLQLNGSGGFSNTTFGVNSVDYGFGKDTNGDWFPAAALAPPLAVSSFFTTVNNPFIQQMVLTNAVPYFDNFPGGPPPFGSGTLVSSNDIVYRAIFLQDNSPTNVSKAVFFGGSGVGAGAAHIQWSAAVTDPVTGVTATNFFYLSDLYIQVSETNIAAINGVPDNFSFAQGFAPLIGLPNPQPPGMPFGIFNAFGVVTNFYAYVNANLITTTVPTNATIFGAVSNVPGRIQIEADNSLNLDHTLINGNNYLSLRSTNNFIGNTGAVIEVPYTDLYLRSLSGSLTLSNLLVPNLPHWSGNLQAFSANWIFVDANGITNDYRVLLVNSDIQPTSPAQQQNVVLQSPNALTISDDYTILGTFSSDTAQLTLTTNGLGAFSSEGELNLLSSSIFWSSSLPNLQYLTNYGVITTANLANFAGNMLNPNSDPNAAVPYQAFVNYGAITNQGTFVRANFFQNSGTIAEQFNANIDIGAGTAIATNGSFIAPNGYVTIAANSLIASNGFIESANALTLDTPCFLSDGYIFENEFGHITNATLPNIVTNGNTWVTAGGIDIPVKPLTGDLLGTTITNLALNNFDSPNLWPGDDRGRSPGGYATNLALGRMMLYADASSSFTFNSLNGSNALYVDSIDLGGNTANTDPNGNPLSIAIQSGMTIYFAEATENGVSIAEKLDGKFGAISGTNGGRFLWVSNYAGVYSSTNILYPDGNTYIFNYPLAISPDIASAGPDGSNINLANINNPYPIPTNELFDIVNIGPQPCDSGLSGNPPGNPGQSNSPVVDPPAFLSFPQVQQSSQSQGSNSVNFTTAAGSYNGLFYETNGVNPARSGFFTAKVTASGSFTAKLQLGSKNYSFSGKFDSSGHFAPATAPKGLGALNVALQLVNNDQITGHVTGSGWSAQLMADLAAFSLNASVTDTLLLAVDDTNSTTATGDGFGTVAISKSGSAQWSGTLPDNTKVTQKSALSKDGVLPLYSTIYGGLGSFIGWMQCATNGTPDVEGSAVWIAPPGKSKAYQSGLTNSLDAIGSGSSGSIGFSPARTILSGATLGSPLTNSVIIFGKNGQSSDRTLKLSINPTTGLFSGSVMHNGQKLSFQGALLEKSGIGGGFFLNADQSESGKVYFGPAN